MKGLPSVLQVRELLSSLRSTPWRKLQEDGLAALEREHRCGTTAPDGFGRGGEGSGSSLTADGHGDPLSALVVSLVLGRVGRDLHRQYVASYCEAVEDASAAVNRALTQLQNIADLRSDAPTTPRACEACQEAGVKDPATGEVRTWMHRGTVNGRLDRIRHLCDAHYQATQRMGREPTTDETRAWNDRGSWRVRDAS